jgi:geranylgeranyl diphosphate synthase type 3
LIIKAATVLHHTCLMQDDVEDGSPLRRGKPAAHTIFGVAQTVNTSTFMYFSAFRDIWKLVPTQPDFDIKTMATDEMLSICCGQGLELLWRDTLKCPTEDEYILMASNKTGGFLRLALKLMSACATTNSDKDYASLMSLMGAFYQIRDDYMDLRSEVYTNTKGFAGDITEGKFSFPIIHGINADPTNHQILHILEKRTTTLELKQHVIDCLEKAGSFDYTVQVLHEFERQIREEIEAFGGNKGLEALMDRLSVKA